MMFALWTALTFLLALARAYSKANLAILRLPVSEINLMSTQGNNRQKQVLFAVTLTIMVNKKQIQIF